jgi:hypothetical protein
MTLNEINRAIQAKAPNVTLYRGRGYHYYIFDDQARNVHESHSEYVPYLYMRNAKTWIADGIAFAEKVEGIIAERGQFGESLRVLSPFAPMGAPVEIEKDDYDLFPRHRELGLRFGILREKV